LYGFQARRSWVVFRAGIQIHFLSFVVSQPMVIVLRVSSFHSSMSASVMSIDHKSKPKLELDDSGIPMSSGNNI
jgi:hypothetical protein